MTSEYYAQYLITMDSDFRLRVTASVAIESNMSNPDSWVETNKWEWATAPGWAAKVVTAIDSGNDLWGRDPAVISDDDILAVIQPMVAGLNNG